MSEPVAYLFWYTYGPRWYLFCPRCYIRDWSGESNKKFIYPIFEGYVQKFKLTCHGAPIHNCARFGKDDDPDFVNADTSLPSPDEVRGENQAGNSPSFRVPEPMTFNIPAGSSSWNVQNYVNYSYQDISVIPYMIVPNTEEI